jgi:hypothetical protein
VLKLILAIAGLLLFLFATLAAFVAGFSTPLWVIPLGGACTAGALVLLLVGR